MILQSNDISISSIRSYTVISVLILSNNIASSRNKQRRSVNDAIGYSFCYVDQPSLGREEWQVIWSGA